MSKRGTKKKKGKASQSLPGFRSGHAAVFQKAQAKERSGKQKICEEAAKINASHMQYQAVWMNLMK